MHSGFSTGRGSSAPAQKRPLRNLPKPHPIPAYGPLACLGEKEESVLSHIVGSIFVSLSSFQTETTV